MSQDKPRHFYVTYSSSSIENQSKRMKKDIRNLFNPIMIYINKLLFVFINKIKVNGHIRPN